MGKGIPGIPETESLFFPFLQTGIFPQLISSFKGLGSSQFSFAPEIRNIPTSLSPLLVAHPGDLQIWFPERSFVFTLLCFYTYHLIHNPSKCCFQLPEITQNNAKIQAQEIIEVEIS